MGYLATSGIGPHIFDFEVGIVEPGRVAYNGVVVLIRVSLTYRNTKGGTHAMTS